MIVLPFDFFASELWIRVLLSVTVTAYLAWEDARTSFMNEKLLYAFVASGVFWNFLFLPSSQWVWVFGLAVLWAVAGWFSYKSGQFGGGDVLLLLGLHLWLPTSPFVPTLWPFALSVLVAAAALASVGSAILYAWKLQKARFDFTKKPIFFLAAFLPFVLLLSPLPLGLTVLFFLLFESGIFYFFFRQELLEKVIIQRVPFSKIEDEDVLATERFSEKDVARFGIEHVLTRPAVEKLKRFARWKNFKTVPIYRDLPRFGPYLLAGLLLCLAVGDFVVWLFGGI